MFGLEPVLVNLELTYVRIDSRFSVICSVFLSGGRVLVKQLISGIDRARQVWPGTSEDELGIDTGANRSRFFHYSGIFYGFFAQYFAFQGETRGNEGKK